MVERPSTCDSAVKRRMHQVVDLRRNGRHCAGCHGELLAGLAGACRHHLALKATLRACLDIALMSPIISCSWRAWA